MNILKFGGTSLANPERMKVAARLCRNYRQPVVVLSAISGTTNRLIAIGSMLREGSTEVALEQINQLETEYRLFAGRLLSNRKFLTEANKWLEISFHSIRQNASERFGDTEEKSLLAWGEILSTRLFYFLMMESLRAAELWHAPDFIRTDEEGIPDQGYLREQLAQKIKSQPEEKIFITQGFICSDHQGRLSHLGRGGSDYTASLIGAALHAEEIEIWTDIDGMHNNDPRLFQNTRPVRRLHFEEAAELAYFGAKILHPSTIAPARKAKIPVRLKNTLDPLAPGTLITDQAQGRGVKAIATKEGITVIRIRSHRMLMAYGFLRSVFAVFEKYRTPIDMITTSEVAVSLTIDSTRALDVICKELQGIGSIETESNMAIISLVGYNMINESGYIGELLGKVSFLPARMISIGGSEHNISLLVSSQHRDAVLRELHRVAFGDEAVLSKPLEA